MDNNCNIYIILYTVIIIFLLFSLFSKNKKIIEWSIAICIYLLFKWIFDYHKCTLSYLECKIRNVKKEDGFLYNFLENIIILNKSENKYIFYFAVTIVLFINLYRKYF